MNFGYSPWQGAAEYGSGLADTLGKILMTIPQMRIQNAQAAYELHRQQQHDQEDDQMRPFKMQYLQSQIGQNNASAAENNARAEYYNQMPGIRQQQVDNNKSLADTKNKAAMLIHEQIMKSSLLKNQMQQLRNKQSGSRFVPGTQYQQPGYFDGKQFYPMTNAVPQVGGGFNLGAEEPQGQSTMGRIGEGWQNILHSLGIGGEQPPIVAPSVNPSVRQINSQEEYDALPPGTPYVDSNGRQAVKH